ncbi:MAG: DUF4911 domain-containing protein [bacterium]|nr:DUF4911 domain-containing protein [bacterium]
MVQADPTHIGPGVRGPHGRPLTGLPPPCGDPPLIRAYQLPPPAIQFLTALMEACDGIGLVRTLDEDRGIVECWVMPDFAADFAALIDAVSREWPVQLLGEEFD